MQWAIMAQLRGPTFEFGLSGDIDLANCYRCHAVDRCESPTVSVDNFVGKYDPTRRKAAWNRAFIKLMKKPSINFRCKSITCTEDRAFVGFFGVTSWHLRRLVVLWTSENV